MRVETRHKSSCYVCLNFQQNITLFLQHQSSDLWHCCYRWRIMSDGNSTPENFLFQGRDTGREVTVKRVLRVHPTPSPPTRALGKRRKLLSFPGWVWGGAPAANDFWTFCAILRVYAVHKYYTWKAGNLVYMRVSEKQSMFVECWCWNNGNRTETGFPYVL